MIKIERVFKNNNTTTLEEVMNSIFNDRLYSILDNNTNLIDTYNIKNTTMKEVA